MKNSINKFEKKPFQILSKHEMKDVKGGWLYWACRNGMTGQGDHYESWMCGEAGLSYVIYA